MFSWLRNRISLERKSLAQPESWLLDLFGAGGQTSSGIVITPRTAMTASPVRGAVQAISETIGQIPIHVHTRLDGGGKERAPDHPAYPLLHDAANDWTTAIAFKEQLTRDALLYQFGGFGLVNRVDGKPVELLRLNPEFMSVKLDLATGEPTYRYAAPTPVGDRVYSAEDIIHIPSPSLTGYGLLHDAREAIALCLVMEQHAARLFGRGARPSGILSFKSNLTPDALAKAKAAWQAAQVGPTGNGTAVMPGDAAWTPLQLTSVDSQFLELRKFQIEEICRVFRIPPIFLADYGRATWANSEEMGTQFLVFTLMPWVKRWEQEIRLKLFAPEERDLYVAEFHTDDLLRAEFDTRMDGYSKAIAARIMNPNEARAAENRAPYAGGDQFINPNVQTARLI